MIIQNLDIDLTKEEKPTLTYTSPKASDAQNDKIIMRFDGSNDFISLTQNQDNSFSLDIDENKLKRKTASYQVSVRLEDD